MASAPAPAAPAPAAPAPAPPPPAEGRWFLSFDCATKTFAFSLCWVALARLGGGLPGLERRAAALRELEARGALASPPAREALAALRADLAGLFRIADGETVDLFPGVPDREIHTVPRLRAVAAYVARRVRPALAAAGAGGGGGPLRVLVEFQMGANARARAVAAALVALFAEGEVALVPPSLKNRIQCSPEGRYGLFAARYSTAYGANKAHASYNFAVLERAFGSGVDPALSASLRGHVADSVMQVWGHLLLGGERCDDF